MNPTYFRTAYGPLRMQYDQRRPKPQSFDQIGPNSNDPRKTKYSTTNLERTRQMQMSMALEVAANSAISIDSLHRLPFQVKELKLIGLDLSRSPHWKPMEVLHWILSLDRGSFIKYERSLRMTILRGDGVNGARLLSLVYKPRVIQSMGIANLKDVASLQVNIQKLARHRGRTRRFMPIVNNVIIPVATPSSSSNATKKNGNKTNSTMMGKESMEEESKEQEKNCNTIYRMRTAADTREP